VELNGDFVNVFTFAITIQPGVFQICPRDQNQIFVFDFFDGITYDPLRPAGILNISQLILGVNVYGIIETVLYS
jgi:hypothetical protein